MRSVSGLVRPVAQRRKGARMQPCGDTTHWPGKVGAAAVLQSKVATERGRLTCAPRRSDDSHRRGGQRWIRWGHVRRQADLECVATLDQRQETHSIRAHKRRVVHDGTATAHSGSDEGTAALEARRAASRADGAPGHEREDKQAWVSLTAVTRGNGNRGRRQLTIDG
jgi:hypothetical protein